MPKPSEQIFRVLPRQVHLTVAAALREWLPGQSWSQIRKLLQSRRVMVSGNLCVDEGRRLRLVDVVKLLPQSAAAPPSRDEVKICYLDEHVVVVEKPAGMTTTRHADERDWSARRRQLQPTLDELLPEVIARELASRHRAKSKHKNAPKDAPKKKQRPVRAVHRLDRETSGLMVFARTPLAERILGQQFRKHTTKRRYLAVALGDVREQTIESRLVRDRGDGRRGSTNLPNVGKPAITHVRPIERLGSYTLVECRLETGRTHQIRIHLSENGHPLCGDRVYRQPRMGTTPIPDESGSPRVALHAAELGFQHPVTGDMLSFEMPMPADLAKFIDRLRTGQRFEGASRPSTKSRHKEK